METENYEHFDRWIASTRCSDFYVSTKGYGYRVTKKDKRKIMLNNHKITSRHPHPRISVRAYTKEGKWLGTPQLAQLVWYVAKGEWVPRTMNIMYKDGNNGNCTIENLYLVPKSEVAKTTGWRSHARPVYCKEFGKVRMYRSAREACSEFFCSYQCLMDFLNGKREKKYKPKHLTGRKSGSSLIRQGRQLRWATKEEYLEYAKNIRSDELRSDT